MPFNRPSLADLNARLVSNIDSRTDGQPRLRRSLFNIFAAVVAGANHEMYGFQAYNAKQILPDTADETHFERHASIKGTTRNSSEYAIGQCEVTGEDDSIIEAGRHLKRADAVEYTVNEEVTITGGEALISVTAVEPGAEGNADPGVSLSFVDTIAGVDNQAIVNANGISNGTDIEQLESWRERHMEIIQAPPHSGAKHDYIIWAKEIPGVTRAWVYPLAMGAGTITVRFVRDNDDNLIPDATEVQAVRDYIAEKMHVTGENNLYVVAPVPVPLDLTIQLTPNTAVVRAAVQAEIKDMLLRDAQPEDGKGKGTIKLDKIREAISIAAGEENNTLLSPTEHFTLNNGEMAVLGEFTWQ